MPTGYELLEHSHDFRVHMMRRLAASLIDAVLIFIPVSLTIYFIDFEPTEILAGVFSGFIWFIYSILFEWRTGTTIGKKVMGQLVVSIDGPMTLSKVIVRNVPKMFWYVFLILDYFVGLGTSKDPRQRWTDTISRTIVIKK